MSRRPYSWREALAQLRADRSAALPVREERLRSCAGLRSTPALTLSAWRGLSGRRYVVAVHGLHAYTLAERPGCVVLAVARDAAGVASIRRVASDIAPSDILGWVAAARADGATELHLHSLAEKADDRAAIVSDLVTTASDLVAA